MGERSLLAICEFNLVRRDSKCFLRCWTSSGAGGRTNQQYVETRDQCGQLSFRFTRKSPRRFCVIYCPSWNVLISVKIQLSGTAFSQTHKSRVCSFARKHVESGRPEHPNQDRKTMNWIWRFQPRCKKWSNGFFSGHRKDQSNQWQQNLQYEEQWHPWQWWENMHVPSPKCQGTRNHALEIWRFHGVYISSWSSCKILLWNCPANRRFSSHHNLGIQSLPPAVLGS